MNKSNINLLYIEDDHMDVDMAKLALDHVCTTDAYKLAVLDDGEKALDFVQKHQQYANETKPDLILLDLNLPKVHGREVLRKIKESVSLKHIPVIILSTSNVQRDIDESYDLGACAYLTKPNELKDYRETFKSIYDFWFRKVSFFGKRRPSSSEATN